MWIALGIIGFLAALVTAIVLLPIKFIIKNDENNELILRYKLLGKTFGEDPDPNDPIIKSLKSAAGVDRLGKAELKKSIHSDGLTKTLKSSYAMIIDLLKEVVALLKLCKITKLEVKIRAVGDGPDEAAIHYGQYCAITYGLLNAINVFVKVRKRGCNVDIGCDFFGTESVFRYDVVLVTRFGRVLAALWRVILAEAKRIPSQQEPQRK